MMFSLSNLSKAAYGLVAGAVCSEITGTISIDHVVTEEIVFDIIYLFSCIILFSNLQ